MLCIRNVSVTPNTIWSRQTTANLKVLRSLCFNQITTVVFEFRLYDFLFVTNMVVYTTHHVSLQINFYTSPHLTGCFSVWRLQVPTLYNIVFFSWVFLILVSLALRLRNCCSCDRFVRSINTCFYILNILVFLNIPDLSVTASSA
jgi:hypothetical protein